MSPAEQKVCVYLGKGLADYGFPDGHPFSVNRHDAFEKAFRERHLDVRSTVLSPVQADQKYIEYFHTHEYVERVKFQSENGRGYLDYGDTPAFPGVYEAAATIVGSVLDALKKIFAGDCRRVFIPIAGLHHARRDSAAGFCVFNDCGVAIEVLRREYGIQRVAYVDIDAHHGDGVFYAFEADPGVIIADFHEDGRYLYPGTGSADETGKGEAVGTKLNLPMPPGADEQDFRRAWPGVEALLERHTPEIILLQCGADSIQGDPITHLAYPETVHAYAAHRLCILAERYCQGRILVMGGGGYDLGNLARAWCAVVEALLAA
jgi:acetoin utilization protein AcuC